ncbi:MAG: hypothetical protein KGY81_00035 [Phycisphaerae bacterium]|nr:hypothetical protein [Phycisphaerae bacterium]
MYLVCGQCGTLNAVTGPIDPSIAAARCSNCQHEVPLALHLRGPEQAEVDRDGLFNRGEVGYATLARKALRERIMVVCGSCQSKMKVGKRLAGKTVKCPSCSAEIRVPFLDEEDQFDISLLISAARQEGEDRDEVVEMDESDYEEIYEDVLIGRGVFKITRTRLILFVASYLIIMIVVLAGGILFKKAAEDNQDTPAPVASPAPVVNVLETPNIPAAAPARMDLKSAVWDTFASAGYRPAPPGRLYVKITVNLQAGSEPISLPNTGRAVTLRIRQTAYESLGEPLDAPAAPVPARRETLRLDPGQTMAATFLFELPPETMAGTLRVRGFDARPVALSRPAQSEINFAGTWIEQPPRNLKPLLRQPIMARLQRACDQRMMIRQHGNNLRIWMPDCRIHGRLTPADEAGMADVSLRHEGERLDCSARLTPDGQRLVLYLDTAPMHQITYRREPAPEPTAQADRK